MNKKVDPDYAKIVLDRIGIDMDKVIKNLLPPSNGVIIKPILSSEIKVFIPFNSETEYKEVYSTLLHVEHIPKSNAYTCVLLYDNDWGEVNIPNELSVIKEAIEGTLIEIR